MAKLDTKGRKKIPDAEYAFPDERKEPLENAAHVRNAVARFNQVKGVSEAEKDAAWKRIQTAAKKFGVELEESSRKELKPEKKAVKKTAAKKMSKSAAKKMAAKSATEKKV